MLKILSYNRYGARIAYFIQQKEKSVFFCGIDRACGSTVNYEEDIISSICKAENVAWQKYKFYDIQSCSGYDMPSGEYEIDIVHLKPSASQLDIHAETWEPVFKSEKFSDTRHEDFSKLPSAPQWLTELFSCHINKK